MPAFDAVIDGLVGIYSDRGYVVAYDDGGLRQQFSICFYCRTCLVGPDLVARLVDAAGDRHPASVGDEARLLELLQPHLDIPVPRPLLIDPEGELLVYRRLPGVPLLDLPELPSASLEADPRAQRWFV